MRLASSARWVAVSQAARVISQLTSITVLARLLPPESYGLMAMAMTVTNLAFLFKDLGTSAAIVQRKELTDELICTVYWLNLGLGLLIGLILVAAAFPIAAGYKQERLIGMIMVLALVFPISSLAAVPQALMERESQFRVLARIEAARHHPDLPGCRLEAEEKICGTRAALHP
jgi:O-antigen/teichoic acid export membrane protein